jgi:hypothetical protein
LQPPDDFSTITQFGILEIAGDWALSILALGQTTNHRLEVLFTTTPSVDLTLPPSYASVSFTRFADGGGYTTTTKSRSWRSGSAGIRKSPAERTISGAPRPA